jgi:hypothetical protein
MVRHGREQATAERSTDESSEEEAAGEIDELIHLLSLLRRSEKAFSWAK